MPSWLPVLQQNAAILFAFVLMIVALFLIARVAKLSQPMSLALALTPMAYAVALSHGIGLL